MNSGGGCRMSERKGRRDAGIVSQRIQGTFLGLCGAFVVMLTTGCAEIVGAVLDDMDPLVCVNCNWKIQQWDSHLIDSSKDGWSIHNSEEYETEDLCQVELAGRSAENPDTGYRCIHEKDLASARGEEIPERTKDQNSCLWGCEWAIEEGRYSNWERIEGLSYKTEGQCQQDVFLLGRDHPYTNYRCVDVTM